MAEILQQKPSAFAAQASASAARQILDHKAPAYKFSFTPFLVNNFRMGISPDRPACKAYLQGHCPLGTNCPDKHATNPNNTWNFNNLSFDASGGPLTSLDECLYLHIDPASKVGNCPHYDKGFCPLGPRCSKKHIHKTLCEFYLAGFCPDGSKCKKSHPRWPSDLPKPTIKVERDPEEIAEEQAKLREAAEREADRERGFGGEGGGRRGKWRGGFSYRGRGGGGGGERSQRGRGH
ncbi:hypothetical protein SBOR_0845 [Sclerotinia borealis F-4128]|uniref:mRNA 3'-end-processing protein n=1 Tax=Sclerotinia borealis (strain F-4128) TaxID=1432307 RepID=W9CVV0_SCLBF|nr:hypothetical protein SBOR_0845 [Sclerotinia borealis F-4128]